MNTAHDTHTAAGRSPTPEEAQLMRNTEDHLVHLLGRQMVETALPALAIALHRISLTAPDVRQRAAWRRASNALVRARTPRTKGDAR